MIRGMDRIYRLDHAITATQKTILGAFGINVPYIKDRVNRISEQLRIADEKKRSISDGGEKKSVKAPRRCSDEKNADIRKKIMDAIDIEEGSIFKADTRFICKDRCCEGLS